jgi:2-phospho-L-lactate guanylyltransferase
VVGDISAAKPRSSSGTAVLVPVKTFADAKERLSPLLDRDARQELARRLAEGVLAAASSLPVAVVCDDDEVAQWATEHGAEVVWAPKEGLNRAVASGVAHLEASGFERITVVHSDLPFPKRLAELDVDRGLLLVPDRHLDGTNVISLPAGCSFEFAYGPGSFEQHLACAQRLGITVAVRRDAALGIDIDLPEDLELMAAETRRWGPEGPQTSITA